MLKSNLGLISFLFASYPLLVSGQDASSLLPTTSVASVTSISDTSFSIIASSSSTAGTAGLPSASSSLQTSTFDTLSSTIPTLPPSTSSAVSIIPSSQSTTPSLPLTTTVTSKSIPPPQIASTSFISTSSTLHTTTEPISTPTHSSSSIISSGSPLSTTLRSSSSFVLSSASSAASTTMASSSSSNPKQQRTIIALAVVLGVALLALLLCLGLFIRRRIQKRMQITKTGNPVLDEEIETWRASKGAPEGTLLTGGGDRRSSTSQREWADEKILSRPVTAKAPNARSGLTDSTVPGEEPFVKVRRNSARLQKRPGSRPSSLLGHQRSQSSFSDREKFRLSAERPKTSDRPTTPHQPVLENLAEKDAPPLPEGAERSIKDRTSGSIVSKRTSDGSHKKRVSS